jgi:tripartite-type tricarboxylate transporter receptor subunit TctC
MGSDRSPVMADVPTTGEQGMPELQAPTWTGLFAPKGTPQPILEKLSSALTRALDDPEIRKKITDLGANVPTPKQRGQAYTDDFVRAEVAKWGGLAKAASVPKQ